MGVLSGSFGLETCGHSELCSLTSVTSYRPKNYFKINLSNNGDESIFMVSDLKKFCDIETELFKRHPEIYLEKLTIYYCDKNNDKILITNSNDFDIFMETHYDQNIYVSWTNESLATKNVPNKPCSWKIDFKDDLILLSVAVFLTLYIILSLVDFGGFFSQDEDPESHPENTADRWSEYRKIIQEFCHRHSSTEKCQSVVSEFMSFMSYDSLANANK